MDKKIKFAVRVDPKTAKKFKAKAAAKGETIQDILETKVEDYISK